MPWNKFCELFRNKYASQKVENGLRIELYARKQNEKEAAAVFLQKKYLLAKRLCPMSTEGELVSTILETLKLSIKRVIRAANPKTFTDLVDRATQAEAEEAEEYPTRSKQEEGVKKLSTSTHNPLNHRETPRLPPCHYCSERHYHRDCPVLTRRMANPPPENWRRAAEESKPNRAEGTQPGQQ